MTGDYLAACIHQDRHDEAEHLDATRDLAYLLRAVNPRVLRVGLQLRNRPIRYCESRRAVRFWVRCSRCFTHLLRLYVKRLRTRNWIYRVGVRGSVTNA